MTTAHEALYDEFRHGEFLLATKKPAQAAQVLEPVVAAAPEHTGALELYARALFASAQLTRAERALRALLQRCPDDGWAHLALARTLERHDNDDDEAATHRRFAAALGEAA